jgi:hypothetical protein
MRSISPPFDKGECGGVDIGIEEKTSSSCKGSLELGVVWGDSDDGAGFGRSAKENVLIKGDGRPTSALFSGVGILEAVDIK